MDPNYWINWRDYTGLELFFYGFGCFLWVLAYFIYIRNIVKFKFVEMPVFAGCCDVAWEFVWSFYAYCDLGQLFQAANVVWFLLDAGFIFTYGVLFFGAKQFVSPQLTDRRIFVPMCLAIAIAAGLATYFMHVQGLDNGVGGRSAYLIQLSISFLYVPLLLRQTTLEHFSWTANWMRAAGSALVVVFFFLHYPDDHFLQTIGVTAALTDATFLVLYQQKKRELAARARAVVRQPALA